ncbi:MAG: NFACT RNA binding domain-containing protein [Oscillospiraceae bacterium]
MPLDATCITALCGELKKQLIGCKIDKVQQPERDTLILSLRGSGQNSKLLISAGVGTARIHFSTQSYENPKSAPMFCMLLRKHLVGARIASLTQPELERILVFELDAFDEMNTQIKKNLIVEMMGRNSNVILTDAENRIIDCMRRVDGDMSRSRQVLPGLFYHLPPQQEKPNFFALSPSERKRIWQEADTDRFSDKALLDSFSGISPLICRELCFRAFGDVSKQIEQLTAEDEKAMLVEMQSLAERFENEDFQPTMLMAEEKPMDFSFMPILQYENGAQLTSYADFSSLLEDFFTRRAKREQMHRRSQSLYKFVKTAHDRSIKKLLMRREELKVAGERELSRIRGELLTANLYKVSKGDRLLVAQNYYEDGCPEVEVPLDPLKSPQQNAAFYFKQYNKAKTAEAHLNDLIKKGQIEEAYLSSVMDAIERSESESDLAEIRIELTDTGFLKKQKTSKREKTKEQPFLRFYSSSGMKILVGKNNVQNDVLTTKTARRTDMWLHVQNIQGSHVIISCGGEAPDEQTLFEAATLTAYFSQARDGGKVPVDYTQVCFVKKPSGSMPGMVVYTNNKTIYVVPDEKLVQSLRVD